MRLYTETSQEPGLSLSRGVTQLCRHFGLPVPAAGRPGQQGLWFNAWPQTGQSLEACCDLLVLSSLPMASEGRTSVLAFDLQPESWGCARLEENFHEDLLVEKSGLQAPLVKSVLPRFDPLLPGQDNELQALFAQIRDLLGFRDWLVYWARSQGQVYVLGVFPWGWDWPQGNWIDLPDVPFPLLPTPLSRELFLRAARDWLETLDLQARENENSAFDWFESLAGKILVPSRRFQTLLGFTPGQAGPLRMGDLGNLATIRQRLRRLTKEIWDPFVVSHSRFQGNLQQWQEIYRQFLPAYLELGALIRSLSAGLEANQTLAGYLSDHLNPSTRLHDQLIPLWERVQDWLDEATSDPDATHDLADLLEQPDFRRSWQLMLGQFGHFAPFGLDLGLPRLLDEPSALLQSLAQPWSTDDYTVAWNQRSLLERPRWQQLARLIDLRESFVADVSWALHQIRQRMEAHATELQAAGKLDHVQDIWWLYPDELSRLDSGLTLPSERVAQRQSNQAAWLQAWHDLALSDADGVMQGQGLQVGVIQGKVLRLNQPVIQLPPGYDPAATILVTDLVDAGWIPCLEQVAGVILLSADLFSAAAILLRELSKPAIVALAAAARLQSGQWVRLNTDTGTISELPAP